MNEIGVNAIFDAKKKRKVLFKKRAINESQEGY
jgi:hypothetical protein